MLLMVGGGICLVEDMWVFLLVGVDKVFLNFLVVVNLDLISVGVCLFGNQCFVIVIDVKIDLVIG